MSVFEYVAAYSDQLDPCRLFLEMRLDGHEFPTLIDDRNVPKACSVWLCRWIHFVNQGAAWLRFYGW